jgi:hypothetical protein
MDNLVITSDTDGEAAGTATPNTSAKPTESLEEQPVSKITVDELPLLEWLMVLATTTKRYEEAGGDISFEQHDDRFVINLHQVFYDEKKRVLAFA